MLKRLLKDSAIYWLCSLLSRGISFFLLPFYTRVFSPDDYGALTLLTVVTSIISLLAGLEIAQGVFREHADAKGDTDRARFVSTGFWFTLAFNGVAVLLIWPFAADWSRLLLGSAAYQQAAAVALLAMVGQSMFYFLQSQLRWQGRPLHFAVASITFSLSSIAATCWLVLGFGLGIAGVFYGTLVGAAIGGAWAWWLSRDCYRFYFEPARAKTMLVYSLPLVPSSLAICASDYMDRVAIQYFLNLSDVGLYSVGYRFASIIGLMVLGLHSAITPLIYQNYQRPEMAENLARIFRYFVVAMASSLLSLAAFAPELLRAFTPPAYHASASLIPVLGVALLFSHMYAFAPGVALARKTKHFASTSIVGALVEIVLICLLIPLMGVLGAALAMAAGALLRFSLVMGLSQRYYPVPHRWGALLGSTFLMGGLGWVGLRLDTWWNGPLWALLAVKALLVLSGFAFAVQQLVGQQEARSLLGAGLARLRPSSERNRALEEVR